MYRRSATTARRRLTLLAVAVPPIALVGLATQLPTQGVHAAGTSTTFGVIGDFGYAGADEAAVASLVAGWAPDAVLATGDDYYNPAGGTGLDKYDITIGKFYCAFLAGAYAGANCPTGGTAPENRFWATTGNHDYTDAGIANYTGYFPYPGNELVFAVTIGQVELFILDSNLALGSATEMASQRAWLETAARASTAAWQVVMFHHPPYSSGANHGSSTAMRWPFADWGIDLVLNGHDHTYERVQTNGITYVVSGLGGSTKYAFTTPVTGSVARYSANFGALRLVATATSLDGAFLSVDGVTQDAFSVTPAVPAMVFRDGSSPTAAYAGTRDVTLSQASPATARGGEATLYLDGDDPAGSGSDHVTLMAWDVSAIPANAVVTSASLSTTVTNASTGSYGVYQALANWTEGQATWNEASTGVPWGAPGAGGATDRGTTLLGSFAATAIGATEVPLNAAGVALVQGWISGSTPNRGLVIADTSTTDGIDLHSRESTTVAARPGLVIRYSVPAPTPSPTPAPTPSPTPIPTPSPTPVATPVPTATPVPAPGAFAKKTPADTARVTTGKVTLTWAASTGATSYQWCLSRTLGTCASWTSTTSKTASASASTRGVVYYWQVRAVRSGVYTYANAGTWWRFTTR